MNTKEFSTAVSRTRLQERTREAARLVLVQGYSKAEVARRVGLSRAAVGAAVARIEREHKGIIGVPRDWWCVTVCVPPEDVADVMAFEERARKRHKL